MTEDAAAPKKRALRCWRHLECDVIYIVNYASGRFLESQRIQNVGWMRRTGDRPPLICSFSRADVLPVLESLHLENESDIRAAVDQPRGDGLWAWKAILTYHVYRDVAREGDIVFYMDSGACPMASFDRIWQHIRAHGHFFVRVSAFETIPKVRHWLESLSEMQGKLHLTDELDFSCRLWTKPLPAAPGDEYGLPPGVARRLRDAPGPASDTARLLMSTDQVCGGFQGYLKTGDKGRILEDMLEATSPVFFDDQVRGAPTHEFIDHRQDQSMLSLIVNAECMRVPAFADCIVNRMNEVCLHRGYTSEYPELYRL